jgi:hypothetical protein
VRGGMRQECAHQSGTGLRRCFHWIIKKEKHVTNSIETKNESLLIDEFEIIELEDRLELAGRCNGRCDGQKSMPS